MSKHYETVKEYEGFEIETITLQELSVLLRSLGMKVSEPVLGSGLEQGRYPFGVAINTDKGGRRYEIYKRLVDEWIRERAIVRQALDENISEETA